MNTAEVPPNTLHIVLGMLFMFSIPAAENVKKKPSEAVILSNVKSPAQVDKKTTPQCSGLSEDVRQ